MHVSAAQMGWTAVGGAGAEGPASPPWSANCTVPRVDLGSLPLGVDS
jgi:hypothetical protein